MAEWCPGGKIVITASLGGKEIQIASIGNADFSFEQLRVRVMVALRSSRQTSRALFCRRMPSTHHRHVGDLRTCSR